jgi:hypothetical protein
MSAAAVFSVQAQAGPSAKNRTGIGLGVGVPSNLFVTGKHWLSRREGQFTPALDFSVRGGNGWIGGDMDYLLHKFYIFKGDLGKRMPLGGRPV